MIETIPCLYKQATLIASFVADEITLDTDHLLTFFTQNMPPNAVQLEPGYAACFAVKSGYPLPQTPVRRVIALAHRYFNSKLSLCSPFPIPVTKTSDCEGRSAMVVLCNYLDGVEMLRCADPNKKAWFCDTFVFRNQPWYRPDHDCEELFNSTEKVFSRLLSYGYRLNNKPVPGEIVVYVNSNEVKHYGAIRIVNDFYVWIVSKWGQGAYYHHRMECVPYSYGGSMFFLTPPQPFTFPFLC